MWKLFCSLLSVFAFPDVFEVARKRQDEKVKQQTLTVWDLDPSRVYSVRVERIDATEDNAASSRSPSRDLIHCLPLDSYSLLVQEVQNEWKI